MYVLLDCTVLCYFMCILHTVVYNAITSHNISNVLTQYITMYQFSGNFIEYSNGMLLFKKYASLYFIVYCDKNDNYIELLEQIHFYVECLDKYFHNVCELDLIFNFYKTYFLLDEVFLYGHITETSKRQIAQIMKSHDNIYQDERLKMKK